MLYNNWLAANMMDEGKIVNYHKSKITITLYSKHPYKMTQAILNRNVGWLQAGDVETDEAGKERMRMCQNEHILILSVSTLGLEPRTPTMSR